MAHTKVVVLASLVSLMACVEEAPVLGDHAQPIINGEACSRDDLPQTVALILDASINFGGSDFEVRTLLCTGTLIAPDTVLTAAHCLDPAGITGGFGTVNNATYYISTASDLVSLAQDPGGALPALPTDALPVRSVVHHEDFTFEIDESLEGLANFHDIGLMFLEDPIDEIEPAIVMTPDEASRLAVGDEVQIAGWGQRGPEQDAPAGLKHCATTAIFEIGDFEMQIGNEPTTSRKCHGDSGGPTFATIETESRRKDRVIGATSRAYDSSDCLKGGVDTMASAWYGWIDTRMSEGCASGDRAWCEVSGVVPPSYYDDLPSENPDTPEEEGGCSTGGSSGTIFGMLLLAFGWSWRRRQASL